MNKNKYKLLVSFNKNIYADKNNTLIDCLNN